MTDVQQFYRGSESFAFNLFSELAKTNSDKKNIVFSPFSIQTCIAMARMGAVNQTALEMDQGLGFSIEEPEKLPDYYQTIMAPYENNPKLQIANKIYIMKDYKIRDEFNETLTKKFFSSVESIDFSQKDAAHNINSWVQEKTNNLIKNLVDPSALSAFTRLLLVNAIHFKGEWVHPFPAKNTRERDFYLDETETIKVQMMRVKENFKYGEFPDLDATALEMPYKDSDLSMLIILPNSRTGLASLEKKNISISDITGKMYSTKVIVDMPKFKVEFQAELTEPLKEMGFKRMFSGDAEFANMLNTSEGFQVSSVIHKAFIEVNEEGTEAAAATGMLIRRKRALDDFTEIKEFDIEHPFLFKILQISPNETSMSVSNLVLFAGKIEQIESTLSVTNNFNEMKDEL